jgi:diaminohydroxyphosphoribosylaminopyrimidine deaminase/5-amino-6-(5-phosphoribosylamino)uracil reductase
MNLSGKETLHGHTNGDAMQVGANPELKRYLKDKGVEVVELPFLSPQGATEYLTMRGCLQLFWECGGILAAPAVQHNCIHKVRLCG